MDFEPDDLDWAMGELLHLFDRASRLGILPHELDPAIFHPAWSVLNAQPFEVRQTAHRTLMQHFRAVPPSVSTLKRAKRYAYALTR
jgi:hypothetical protein